MMGEMTKDELAELIEGAAARGIEKKFGEFYVERERHWEHHEFINGFIKFIDTIKNTALKTFVRTVVYGLLFLLLCGFLLYVYTRGGVH